MEVQFLYDIACPYAYLASLRIGRVAAEAGATLRWTPVLLGGIYRALGGPDDPSQSWSPQRAAMGARDRARQAARWGVSLSRGAPRRTVEAQRLLVSAPDDARPALTAALYRAWWEDGRDVSDKAVLGEVAQRVGVDPAGMDSPEARAGLYANTAYAVERGAFGVPTVVVGGRIYWGQDRLPVVRAALGLPPDERAPGGPLPSDMGPRAVGAPSVLRVFHDFASPFSYLAWTQVDRVAAATGASVEWAPILLGALFRAIGTPIVPLFAMSEAKRSYLLLDLQDQAARWRVPFRFPETFPVRTVLPLRVALADARATGPLYRALWVEGRDIGDPAVVADVLEAAGLPADALLTASQEPHVKAMLHANTAQAQRVGACGVPTFQVDGGEPFWGGDRLEMVEAALRASLRG